MTDIRYGENLCLQFRAMCVCLCKKCVCNFEGCVFALLSGERETVKALIVFSWLELVCLPGLAGCLYDPNIKTALHISQRSLGNV